MKNIIYEETTDGKRMLELESEGWHNSICNLKTGVMTYSKYIGKNLKYSTKKNISMTDFFGKNKIVSDQVYKIIDNWCAEHGITDDPNYLKGSIVRLSDAPEKFSTEARVVSVKAKRFCYMPIAKDSLKLCRE